MIILELSKRDLSRINCVDLLVSKYYKCSLYEFCKKYKYDLMFLDIVKKVTSDYGYDRLSYLAVDLEEGLEERYYQVEQKFSYGSDNRSIAEKVISLGVNWVVEDVIVHKSSSVFILTGCDNSRDLLANPITNTPDIRYVGLGESFYVEVCSDFTNFMKKNRRYDLRKLKYCKLEDLLYIEGKRTVLLFVDVVNKSYFRNWFSQKTFDYHDKYLKNTVAFEFDSSVIFKSLDDLFESCKKCQTNPSLYSNFNIEEIKVEKKPVKFVEDIEDPGYWDSLFENEPAFIRCRVPDIDENGEEIESNWNEIYKDENSNSGVSIENRKDMGFEELPEDTWTPFDEDITGIFDKDLEGLFGDSDSPF